MLAEFRAWRERFEDRAAAHLWVRRLAGVAATLFLAFTHVYLFWRLGPDRSFDAEGIILIGLAAFALVVNVVVIEDQLPRLGKPRWFAVFTLVPVAGELLWLRWTWQLANFWRTPAQVEADRERLLMELEPVQRDVYRLRFDSKSDSPPSKREVARQLGVSRRIVADAERRIRRLETDAAMLRFREWGRSA